MIKLRKNRTLTLFVLVAFILNIFSMMLENKVKADTNDIKFTLEKTVEKSEVFAGEDFTYTIKYANPNTTTDAHNVVITDELPSNIKYVSYTPSEDIAVTTTGSINGHDLITFTFKEPLKAGKTGFVKITARFPAGTTQGGSANTAKNVAKIKGDNGLEVVSNEVTVTPKVNVPNWKITKTKTIPSGTPAVGGNVTYQITITGNSAIGGLNLHDVKLVDTIPAGGEYISSSNGGVYDSATGKVTWDIGNVNVGASVSRTVTVKYPSVKVEDSVTNVADGYVELLGDTTVLTKQATLNHGFAAAAPSVANFTKNGRQADDRYSLGQTAQFTLNNIQNTGNVPLDKIEIVDSIPKEITLTSISTGAYSSTANIEVQYEINSSGSWNNWTGTPVPSNTSKGLNASSITLDSGEKITAVKWILTNGAEGIAPGFKNTSAIAVNGAVSKPDTGDKITNNATLTATKDGISPIIKTASKIISVIDPMPWLVPTKTVKNGQTKFNMNDTVEYNLRIENHAFATGDYINPIAVDILPAEMEDVQIIGWDKGNTAITQPPVVDKTQTKTIGGVTHQILKWNFTGTLTPGKYVNVQFSAKIKDKTLSGKYTNTLYITTNDQSVFENPSNGLIDDTNGLNAGTNFPNKLAATSNEVFVNFTGTADSQKWVKGELDTDWNYYDISNRHGYTLPGGVADYQLRVKNTGANGPINNIVIIDVLPYIGDTGVIDTKARASAWRPYLVNRITGENGGTLPAGVKVYYSTNPNPSKEELKDPKNKKGLFTDGWSETPPLDITSVRALKFDFGNNPLNKNEEKILQWPMRAPYEAPVNEIAWNSFGYGATFVDVGGDQPFLPSEPKKVGFEVQQDPAAKYYIGNFVWEDMNKDGLQNDGETGINGALVNLYEYNSVIGDFEYTGRYTRTGDSYTGKTGYYEFPNVAPGTYKVEFVLPTGYKVTPYNVGGDREIDSNIDWSNKTDYIDNGTTKSAIKTADIVITDKNDFSIDAGIYKLASLGDKVWNDKNANGIQDAGEVGISGVKVTLLDKDGNPAKYGAGSQVQDVITDANGNYKFENLEPGIYKVKFTNPNGDYKFTQVNALGSNKDTDSDAIADLIGLTATTAIVSLKSGEDKTDVDAGMYLAQLGDYVWEDKNANGIQDAGETGISGVKVNLFNEDGTPAKDEYGNNVPQAVTGADGKYLFDNLKAGKYIIEFVKPTGYDKFSKSVQGSDSLKDSDADATTGKTSVITLDAAERDMSWDAGLYKLASLGDFAWLDKNVNGIQDAGEPTMPGVTVKLLDKDGNPAKYEDGTIIPDAITDANGKYSFTSLVPGSYTVQFVKDSYYKFTDSAKGADKEKDSNVDSTGKADVILASGENNITIDAGYVINSGIKLEKTVYVGHDGGKGSGVENVKGEKGTPITYLFKVTNTGTSYLKDIFLDDTTLQIDKSKMTKLSGDELLAPGATIVYYYETTITKDFTNTAKVEGTPSDDKGTPIPNGDKISAQDTAVIGELIPGMKIEKTVYAGHDNGTQSGGELVVGEKGTPITYVFKITNTGNVPLNGITINDADLKINKSKMTYKERSENAAEDIPLGVGQTITYYYETTINGDLTNTAKTEGTPSDNAGTPFSNVNKPSAEDTAKVDEVKPAITVEKTVYKGHDGGKSSGVELVSGKPNSDVTYLFTVKNTGDTDLKDITINDADLKIDKSKMIKLSGDEPLTTGASIVYYYEGKINGDLVNTVQVSGTPIDSKGTAVPNTHNPVASDTAEVKLSASLGDYVWVDSNSNGKQEPTEKGIPKVKVILTDSKGNTSSTVTDDNGKYLFDDLMPGNYTVSIDKTTIPVGMVPSYELDITLDNKVDLTLSSNQFKDDVDFGYYTPSSGGGGVPIVYKLASVGDYVWYDRNGDGKQDSNEKGIAKVKLILTDEKGRVSATTTDDNGKYLFSDLMPGKYTINLDPNTLPEGLKQTYELDKALNGEVSVSLVYNQFKDDVDFGYNKSGINIDDDKTPIGPGNIPKGEDKPKPTTNIDDDSTPKAPADLPKEKGKSYSNGENSPSYGNLPKTGTEYFNLLMLGVISLAGSGVFIFRRRGKGKAK